MSSFFLKSGGHLNNILYIRKIKREAEVTSTQTLPGNLVGELESFHFTTSDPFISTDVKSQSFSKHLSAEVFHSTTIPAPAHTDDTAHTVSLKTVIDTQISKAPLLSSRAQQLCVPIWQINNKQLIKNYNITEYGWKKC